MQFLTSGQFWDYAVIVIYMLTLIGIGIRCAGGEKTSENYLMGGRNMHFVAVGLACIMALLSSISLVVVPGEICNHGLTLYVIGMVLCWLPIPCYLLFVRFYFRLGSFTPYEYLEYRYDRSIRALVSVSAFYSRIIYLGMVVYTTAKIFEAAYHWPPWVSILAVSVVGMIYTVIGGAKAVVWTDVLQFFVLLGSFLVVIVALCFKIDGGAVAAVKVALEQGHGAPQFTMKEFYSLSPYVRLLFFLMLWGSVTGHLSIACSDQISIQRLMSTKNWKDGFKAQCVATFFSFFFSVILWFVGLAVFTYYYQHPDPFLEGTNRGDLAFFHFVATNLPHPLPGLFIAGMLAAIMSTLSSGMNSMATVWLKEFHVKFINKNLSAEGEVNVSKIATVCIGLFTIAFGLALNASGKWLQQSVAEVQTIFYVLGCATLPAFLCAVLSKRANSKLIWAYTFFGFTEAIGSNMWYAMSRTSQQAYWKAVELGEEAFAAFGQSYREGFLHRLLLKDPQFGWAGRLTFWAWAIPALVGLLCCVPYLMDKADKKKVSRVVGALVGMLFLGFALSMALWCFYSNLMVDPTVVTDLALREVENPKFGPLARSFNFSLPISFLGTFVALLFCPVQPKEKYQGLTVWTINQPVLAKR